MSARPMSGRVAGGLASFHRVVCGITRHPLPASGVPVRADSVLHLPNTPFQSHASCCLGAVKPRLAAHIWQFSNQGSHGQVENAPGNSGVLDMVRKAGVFCYIVRLCVQQERCVRLIFLCRPCLLTCTSHPISTGAQENGNDQTDRHSEAGFPFRSRPSLLDACHDHPMTLSRDSRAAVALESNLHS